MSHLFGEENDRLDDGGPSRFSRSSGIMKSIRRSFRRRKKPRAHKEQNKPAEWIEDERKVKDGSCQFRVKYLGSLEVTESRGIAHCEEAVKKHKLRRERRKTRALLCVSPETIRLVKEKNKQLILDQTIEKVSFCAPDGTYEKAFSYICRDGATKRWMCYSFTAMNATGDRLSHAVGAAFKACLERKKTLEQADVNITINSNAQETSFTREGTYRVTKNPPTVASPSSSTAVAEVEKPVEPKPDRQIEIKSVPRPQAPENLKRQASLRSFVPNPKQEAFKLKGTSMRENQLQVNIERFKGKEILNPVPEVEGEETVKPVQAVQPFQRNFAKPENMPKGRKLVEPIREENPWSETSIARSQTQPSFRTAFDTTPEIRVPPAIPARNRGDVWIESVTRDVIPQIKTGDSAISTASSGRIPPVIPKRTNTPNAPFQRQIPTHMSMRLPNSQSAPTGAFQRSQSVRFGSSGMSSTSSSPNPFQEAPFPSNTFDAQWEALGKKHGTDINISLKI